MKRLFLSLKVAANNEYLEKHSVTNMFYAVVSQNE